MNKRFWVNIIIAMLSYPVNTALQHAKAPLEIRTLWLGVTLACLFNGVAIFFAKNRSNNERGN